MYFLFKEVSFTLLSTGHNNIIIHSKFNHNNMDTQFVNYCMTKKKKKH